MDRSDRVDVLVVSTDLDLGGAERQLVEVAARLASRGWKIAIVSLKPIRSTPVALRGAGVRVAHLGFDRALGLPTALGRIRRLERRLEPTIVHAHMIHANLLARLARLGPQPSPPLVCTSHSDGEEGSARLAAMRLTDRLGTVTTHVSSSILRRYVERRVIAPERAVWIPNGVDLRHFRRDPGAGERARSELGIDATTFCWLMVGGLRAIKRHDLAIGAFERLNGSPRLLIAGAGDRREAIEARIAASPASARIDLLGLRDDTAALMDAADALVLSSDGEALPLVLAEAAACELPVVSTDVGGCRELIDDGVTGVLVPPNDEPALAEAMAAVQRLDRSARADMGSAGRAKMEHSYDIDGVVDQWSDLYRSLAPGAIGPSPDAS